MEPRKRERGPHAKINLDLRRPDCMGGGPPSDMSSSITADGCLAAGSCARRRSVIVYDVLGWGQRAGLLDRANAFAALGNLAAALCAHVVVGRPCDMLAPKHNVHDGRETPINCTIIKWSQRYVNLTFPDGESVLKGFLWHEVWRKREPKHVKIGLPPYTKLERQRQIDGNDIDARNHTALASLFNLVRAQWRDAAVAARNGEAFEWRIRDKLAFHALSYSSVNPGRARLVKRGGADAISEPQRADGSSSSDAAAAACAWKPPAMLFDNRVVEQSENRSCIYIRHDSAAYPHTIATRFVSSLGLEDGAYYAIHLRRNDKASPSVCNTTVPRVVEIVRESLLTPRRLPRLVVFTDERRDLSYTQELLKALSHDEGTRSTRVDLGEPLMLSLARQHDPLKATRGLDNFLVFAAELEVYRRAALSLHVCTACPRGEGAEECTEELRKLRDEPRPRATGLMGEWVQGGTG